MTSLPVTKEASAKADQSRVQGIGHGALWSGTNTLVMKVTGIAITAVVVRVVTPHDFGVFAVALVVYTIVSAFSELGLSACIARRDLDPNQAAPVVALLAMASCLALSVAMALSAGSLAALLGAPDAEAAIRVLSISILISSLTTVSNAMLIRDFRQGRIFASTAISFVPANLALVLLALGGDGALAFAWSRVIGQVVAGIVVISGVPWYWPRWNRRIAKMVLLFGLPLAGANLLNYMLLNADYAFIGRLLGPALLGTYMLAFNVASWSTSVLGATVNGVAMPAFSALRNAPGELRATFRRWLRLTCLVAFPVSALTVALAPDIIHVLYGTKWDAAAPILAVLAIYGGIFVGTLLMSNLLVGIGMTGRVFIIQAIWLAMLLPAVALGIRFYGLEGAAYAHVAVVALVVAPVFLLALRKPLPGIFRIAGKAVLAPFVAALVAGLTAWGAGSLVGYGLPRLLVGASVGALIYFVVAVPLLRTYIPARMEVRMARLLSFYDTIFGRWAEKGAKP